MSNYWSISIGINQYHYFQPLMQAQNDALALHRFLLDEVGFDDTHSVLLSDLSVSARHEAVYPDQRAILEWLQIFCQQKLAPDDHLWVFFSGYGAQAEGEDYLMPVDGDPANISQTGLKLRAVIDLLKQAPTQNLVLVLDMNRSQSALAGQQIGAKTLELAKAAGLPLLLSCQPDQFSHETLAVRHGLFSAALLEGLRYHGCFTLAHLSNYLKTRLPELCEHHWRPVQNPVAVIPDEQKFMALLPQSALESLQTVPPPSEVDAEVGSGISSGSGSGVGASVPPDSDDLDLAFDWDRDGAVTEEPAKDVTKPREIDLSLPDSYITEPDPTTTVDPPDDPVRSGNGGQLTAWGLLVALLLLGGVAIRNLPFLQAAVSNFSVPEWAIFNGAGDQGDQGDLSAADDLAANNGATDGATDETADETASEGETTEGRTAAKGPGEDQAPDADPSSNGEPIDTSDSVAPDNSSTEPVSDSDGTASDSIESDGIESDGIESDGNATSTTPDQLQSPEPPIDNADVDTPTASDSPDDANSDATSDVTSDTAAENTISDPSELIAESGAAADNETSRNASADRQANRSMLESARQSIDPNQASRFIEAIDVARRIQPGEPFYDEAQADITRWSQVILDMAEGRAAGGNLATAIAAAKLVPTDQQTISQQAQQRIAFWQQRQRSRGIIQEAQGIPRMGQANTYQRAILLLRQVPAGQPEYASAQRLIDDWSQKMLSIAQARAAQGRNQAAIQAAQLIPQGTAAHEQAQSDIQRWQGN